MIPVRVGIDVAQLSDPALTGIPLYIEGLLREFFSSSGDDSPALTLVGSQRGVDLRALLAARGIAGPAADRALHIPAADFRLAGRFPGFGRVPPLASLVSKWDGRVAIPIGNVATTRRLVPPLDLFHHTSILRVRPSGARRHLVTIYDLTTRFYPETHNRVNIAEWERVFAFARDHAAGVVTDSESARQDIIRELGVPAERVHAIPLGLRHLPAVSPADHAAARAQFDLNGRRFVLAVGSLEPRKNLPLLIDAFARLIAAPGMGDVVLVLTGARLHGARAVDDALLRHGVADRVRLTGYVPDATLAALFQTCDVFAYPSLYEGFGLPVLEAMALGAPVVTSNVSSLPEVAGDAALLLDPHDPDALAAALSGVLADPALAADLRARGRARAAHFTNRRMADAHLRLYRQIAAG
jgi:glycosyltransferase involved in cell wall biosynthesis